MQHSCSGRKRRVTAALPLGSSLQAPAAVADLRVVMNLLAVMAGCDGSPPVGATAKRRTSLGPDAGFNAANGGIRGHELMGSPSTIAQLPAPPRREQSMVLESCPLCVHRDASAAACSDSAGSCRNGVTHHCASPTLGSTHRQRQATDDRDQLPPAHALHRPSSGPALQTSTRYLARPRWRACCALHVMSSILQTSYA